MARETTDGQNSSLIRQKDPSRRGSFHFPTQASCNVSNAWEHQDKILTPHCGSVITVYAAVSGNLVLIYGSFLSIEPSAYCCRYRRSMLGSFEDCAMFIFFWNVLLVDGVGWMNKVSTILLSSQSTYTSVTTDDTGQRQNVIRIHQADPTIPLPKPGANPRCRPRCHDSRFIDMGVVHSTTGPKISISTEHHKAKSVDARCWEE